MVKIANIIKIIEEFAPIEIAADYDNVGLKIGDPAREVTGILVVLDTNSSVVEEAKAMGCNMIIEHHPSIWRPLKAINISIPLNKMLIECAKNDIALYSAHTNIDFTVGGLNDFVAEILGLSDVKVISDQTSARIGLLSNEVTLKDYAKTVSEILNDDNIITVGRLDKPIKKVAVINGAGGNESELWQTYAAGADVFVTAEVRYNVTRLAKDLDYAIIQFGHYESEVFFMPLIKKVITNKLPSLPIYFAKHIGSPYNKRGEIWN